jgi:hypothetical protein
MDAIRYIKTLREVITLVSVTLQSAVADFDSEKLDDLKIKYVEFHLWMMSWIVRDAEVLKVCSREGVSFPTDTEILHPEHYTLAVTRASSLLTDLVVLVEKSKITRTRNKLLATAVGGIFGTFVIFLVGPVSMSRILWGLGVGGVAGWCIFRRTRVDVVEPVEPIQPIEPKRVKLAFVKLREQGDLLSQVVDPLMELARVCKTNYLK